MILVQGHIVHEVLPQCLDGIGVYFGMLQALLAVVWVLLGGRGTLLVFFEDGLFLQLTK
jgi:hypothetical protein